MIDIAIINQSTVVSDHIVADMVHALQIQVDRDFFPTWGVAAHLYFTGKNDPKLAKLWELVVLDDSDQAGALGYHDVTAFGLPLGKVFAKSDLQVGSSVSVTLSHELLEMLADPAINACVTDSTGINLYALEVCDACEDDSFGYLINNVKVSDFVLPAWFQSFWQAGATKFDFQDKIVKPFQLLPNGYISVMNLTGAQGWTQLTADGKPSIKARAPLGSRRERRKVPHVQRILSTI